MKIAQIIIQNFRQFRNLELDLTYPKGHPKEGQPLDKICIIGQNGTGKTTILELVKGRLFYGKIKNELIEKKEAYFFYQFQKGGNQWNIQQKGGSAYYRTHPEELTTNYFTDGLSLLFFPSGISNELPTREDFEPYNKELFELDSEGLGNVWRYLREDTKQYQKEEFNFRVKLTQRAEKEDIDIKQEMEIWRKEHPNPLLDVAALLNPIFEQFNLKVKTEVGTIDELETLQLQSTNSEETIPYEQLSSGTRQLLFTLYPLLNLVKQNPNSIVMVDEPETSLYPDLQRKIITYYTQLAQPQQYIFATHSPIIAAAFEPWEIVDLEFDADGFVTRHLYYEGENHVKNYTIYPQYLRWDSVLQRVFDVKASGSEEREQAIYQLAELKNQLEYWRKEGKLTAPEPNVQEAITAYKKLLMQMDWKENNQVNL